MFWQAFFANRRVQHYFFNPPPFTLFTFTSPTLIVSLVQFNKCSLSLVPFIFPNFGFLQTKIVLPSSNCLSEGSLQKLGNGDFCKPQNSTFEIDSCRQSSNCNYFSWFFNIKNKSHIFLHVHVPELFRKIWFLNSKFLKLWFFDEITWTQ